MNKIQQRSNEKKESKVDLHTPPQKIVELFMVQYTVLFELNIIGPYENHNLKPNHGFSRARMYPQSCRLRGDGIRFVVKLCVVAAI